MKSTISNFLFSLAIKAFDFQLFELSWKLARWSLDWDVENFYAWFLRGNLLLDFRQDASSALEVFSTLDKYFNPPCDEVKLCKGLCFWDLGQIESALVEFLSAFEIQPSLEAKYHIALAYFNLGEYSLAEKFVQEAIAESPKDVSALNLLSIIQEYVVSI